MKTKTLLASLAVGALVLAQPAAAATRSGDSLPRTGVESSEPAQRLASPTDEAEAISGSPWLWIVLVFIALGGVVALTSGGNDSPG